MQNPKVSVFILNYNGKQALGDLLDKCLDSILASDYSNFEVLFIDNGSVDESAEYIRTKFSSKGIKVIELDQNYGWAGGNNRGVKFASEDSRYFAFVNNDVIFTPSWLKKIMDVMKDNNIGVAGPVALSPNGGIDSAGALIDIEGDAYDFTSIDLNRQDGIDVFYVNSPIIRRDVFETLNGFDENYFCYYEETDFCSRVHALNLRVVVVPNSIIYHFRGMTFKKVLKNPIRDVRTYYYIRNRFYFLLKNHPHGLVLRSILGALLRTFILFFGYLIYEREITKCVGVVQGLLDFIKTIKIIWKNRRANKYKLSKQTLEKYSVKGWRYWLTNLRCAQ